MKIFLVVVAVLILARCSVVSPAYQFYAHKHFVPMLSAHYVDIPKISPQSEQVFVEQYIESAQKASVAIEQHRKRISSPGISAAVAVNGGLVWAGTSGWADIEQQQALSTSTQFRIGSTSKALNATLLARMVDAKQLNLDTKISNFEVGRSNQNWSQITPRHLVSHMAGIPHYKDNTDWVGLYKTMALSQRFDDVVDAVSVFDSSDMLFAPGERFSYSSLGTVLLSAVMQQASNVSYQQAMQQQVLSKLDMTMTLPEPVSVEYADKSPSISTFYWHPEDKGTKVKKWREVDLSHRLAGGGFISTSTDLVKLGLGFIDPNFISAEVRDAFWTPQKLNNGSVNGQKYALGWRVRESDFGEKIGALFHANHGGVSRGAQSWLMVIPEYEMVVAININANTEEFWDFGELSFELVQIFLEDKVKPD